MSGFSDYRAIPALNWSLLKTMQQSPAHFKYAETHERDDTPAMLMGRAVHCAVLQPDAFPLEFCVWQGGRRQGKQWESFVDSLPTKASILSEAEYARCLAIRDAVRSHPVAASVLDGCETEKTLTWTDPETGLDCKARLDAWIPGTVVDLKTTRHVDPRLFARTVADRLYHGQAAHYTAGAKAVSRVTDDFQFVFVAVESEPPHDVAVYVLDDDSMWAGEELVKSLLRRVKECRETGQWPGAYPDKEQTLTLPPWAFPDDGTAKLEGYL